MPAAMGTLRWPPETFWRATMMDFTSALKGYLASKGIDVRPGVTAADFQEELELQEQEKAETGGNDA